MQDTGLFYMPPETAQSLAMAMEQLQPQLPAEAAEVSDRLRTFFKCASMYLLDPAQALQSMCSLAQEFFHFSQ